MGKTDVFVVPLILSPTEFEEFKALLLELDPRARVGEPSLDANVEETVLAALRTAESAKNADRPGEDG